MESSKKKELEIKLREMLKLNNRFRKAKSTKPTQVDTGHIIRRRKGESDKRISEEVKQNATDDNHFSEKVSKR